MSFTFFHITKVSSLSGTVKDGPGSMVELIKDIGRPADNEQPVKKYLRQRGGVAWLIRSYHDSRPMMPLHLWWRLSGDYLMKTKTYSTISTKQWYLQPGTLTCSQTGICTKKTPCRTNKPFSSAYDDGPDSRRLACTRYLGNSSILHLSQNDFRTRL